MGSAHCLADSLMASSDFTDKGDPTERSLSKLADFLVVFLQQANTLVLRHKTWLAGESLLAQNH